MTVKMITVLEPVAKLAREELPMPVRPNDLNGKVLGLIHNDKHGGEVLLERYVDLISKRFKLAHVLRHHKPRSHHPIAEDVLDEFSAKCDFVIGAVGD
ncbi:hypothetical protein ACFLT4_05545 [Chloroflexota bacterium]